MARSSNRTKTQAAAQENGRSHDRRTDYQTVGLRIEPHYSYSYASIYRAPDSGGGRPTRQDGIDGKLIDVSKGGLGVETLTPVPLATLVNVRGELHSVESCIEFRATAWVVHCLAREEGVFRIGLNFEKVDCWPLECEHDEGFEVNDSL